MIAARTLVRRLLADVMAHEDLLQPSAGRLALAVRAGGPANPRRSGGWAEMAGAGGNVSSRLGRRRQPDAATGRRLEPPSPEITPGGLPRMIRKGFGQGDARLQPAAEPEPSRDQAR